MTDKIIMCSLLIIIFLIIVVCGLIALISLHLQNKREKELKTKFKKEVCQLNSAQREIRKYRGYIISNITEIKKLNASLIAYLSGTSTQAEIKYKIYKLQTDIKIFAQHYNECRDHFHTILEQHPELETLYYTTTWEDAETLIKNECYS